MSKYEKSSQTYDTVYVSKKDSVKEAEHVHGQGFRPKFLVHI